MLDKTTRKGRQLMDLEELHRQHKETKAMHVKLIVKLTKGRKRIMKDTFGRKVSFASYIKGEHDRGSLGESVCLTLSQLSDVVEQAWDNGFDAATGMNVNRREKR